MSKKQPTEKQLAARKRFGEAAKKRAEEAKTAKKQAEKAAQTPAPEANENYDDLLKQIKELKESQALMQAALLKGSDKGSQVSERGITGTFEKYVTDPKHYPDPRDRIFEYFESNPKLRRIGLKNNYEMNWEVSAMRPYERIDGVMETQPRFHLELNYIITDPDTYEPTTGRFTVKNVTFFEDPQTAITIARDHGLDVPENLEKAFLDEMRFLRVRDWLEDAFFPKQQDTKPRKKDMVIGGKRVQYFEVSSENTETIPFDQLQNKIK